MPRGQKTAPLTEALVAPAQAPQLEGPKTKALEPHFEKRLRKTSFHHIYFYDKHGDGRMIEIALVKAERSGGPAGRMTTIRYIDVNLLDNVDKGRLKTIVMNVHADKYELWDLMSQNTLNNGKNALDYFHQLTVEERGPGSINTQMGGGLASVRREGNQIIGSEFSDPASGGMDGSPE